LNDFARQSEKLIEEARRLRDDNRAGGRHRRAQARSIGRGSADLRQKNLMTRIKLIGGSLLGIVFLSMVAGLSLDGIGFTGIMVAFLAVVAATFLFSNFPKVKVPSRADLNTGDVRHMVARTELWLEAQRPALPAPAVQIVDGIGVQLDALGLQLEGLDQSHPSAVEVRKLVGETLPGMVDSYRRIPANLRREKRPGGLAPDEQLTESLGKISTEIDSITRQLAQGSLDDLAIKHRYLDYKYGDAEEIAQETPRQAP
jgi:hypothetical protein